MKPVTIVVPVYGDWSSLSECIQSLIAHVDLSKNIVMFVNDCGPDADTIEANIKSATKGVDGIEYYRNKKNLGFIGTCNRAVQELDKSSNDILLLNSDTKVTKGFLVEMASILQDNPKVGAVSPRSNNASLTTVPISTAIQKGINLSKAYKVYEAIKSDLPRYYEAPTAHGFCMLIRRSLIVKHGLFDTIFGKGYGEEVDFCQRLRKAGYKCVIANHAFVYHLEARSFSMEAKQKLLETNNKIIWERYPKYREEVRQYINKVRHDEGLVERKNKVSNYLGIKHRIKSQLTNTKTYKRLAGN